MSSIRLLAPAAVLLLVTLAGCGTSARLVTGSPDGGVVAIPSNSNAWPFKYREEAEQAMAQRRPNGYEILDEKEVVIGKSTTTSENVERRTPTNNDGRVSREQTSTSTTTAVSDQTEYRITFRAKPVPQTVLPTSAVSPAPSERRSTLPPPPLPLR